MATLSEKRAELATAKDALAAARIAVGYGQGDRSVTRARVPELEQSVARLSREVREMEAAEAGAPNPGVVVPTWT